MRTAGFDKTYDGPTGRIGKLVFRRASDGWFVTDDGVEGGVHLDGCRVQQLPLFRGRPVDVEVGSPGTPRCNRVRLEVVAGTTRELKRADVVSLPVDRQEAVSLVVDGVEVHTDDDRRLLHRTTFALPVGTLTAVIGPSGAGKSTLLRALTGQRACSSGRVEWRGCDLHADPGLLRSQVGLVPQEEILHPQLTVRDSLTYAARLRLPPSSTEAERATAVRTVIARMGLDQRADVRIENLSGGQRKRVSIATELLTAPPLLFLDEPTSGLDPGRERAVLEQLRGLADEGRVVVVATHSVMGLDACDTVVAMARGGTVAYVGPPAGLLEHFGAHDYPDLFDLLETGKVAPGAGALPRRTRAAVRPPMVESPSAAVHLRTLVRRNLAVMVSDRMHVAMLVALPLLLALLTRVVQGEAGLSMHAARMPDGQIDGGEAGQRLTILIVAAALLGVAMTVRELVGERPVFRREYAVGLSPGVYHLSKVLVFAPVCFLQGAVVTWLALVGLPGPDRGGVHGWGWWEIAVPVGLVAVAMALVGLLVSALVRSAEQAMPALVAVVMTQLVLSSALVHLAGRAGLNELSWIAPARWGYAAAASSAHLEAAKKGVPGEVLDPLFTHSIHQWNLDLAVLVGLAVLALLAGRRAIRRSVAG